MNSETKEQETKKISFSGLRRVPREAVDFVLNDTHFDSGKYLEGVETYYAHINGLPKN